MVVAGFGAAVDFVGSDSDDAAVYSVDSDGAAVYSVYSVYSDGAVVDSVDSGGAVVDSRMSISISHYLVFSDSVHKLSVIGTLLSIANPGSFAPSARVAMAAPFPVPVPDALTLRESRYVFSSTDKIEIYRRNNPK